MNESVPSGFIQEAFEETTPGGGVARGTRLIPVNPPPPPPEVPVPTAVRYAMDAGAKGGVLGTPRRCTACGSDVGWLPINSHVMQSQFDGRAGIGHMPGWVCLNCGVIRLSGFVSPREGLPEDFDGPAGEAPTTFSEAAEP